MTRINVFKPSRLFPGFYITFGVVFALLGIVLLGSSLLHGSGIKFSAGDWSSALFIIQGILFVMMGAANLASRKYFIEWDDSELRYLLPGSKKPETLSFSRISSLTTGLFEISILIDDKLRIIDLSNLQFEDLKKIKEKLGEIKDKLGK
jgi:hypothetical protein